MMSLPTLLTDRLILRQLTDADAASVFEYASNPNITKYVSWEPHQNEQQSLDLIRFFNKNYDLGLPDAFGICFKEDPEKVIGTIGGFWNTKSMKIMELGCVIGEPYWKQNIAYEAHARIIQYLWENFDVNRIQGRCHVDNLGSKKLMEGLGMRFEGTAYSGFYAKGKSWDMLVFSLVRNL